MTPQRYALEVSSAPAAEPLDLGEAKGFCKVDIDDDNDLFEHWITTARKLIEALLDQACITQTLKLYLDSFPVYEIQLPRSPVASISSVTYVDTSGTTQTLSASEYQLDAKSLPARLVPVDGYWPATKTYRLNCVTITYIAGYGSSGSSVPEAIKQAMYQSISTWNVNRESLPTELPIGVQTFLLSVWDGRY